ncbi:ATP-dependent rRNA helicase spb4 [Ascosphaera acerosa]|nr:ATP-dependent rRNA helicase spb4 [Ascosphaera acerosa]
MKTTVYLLPPPGASESASESASDAGPGTVVATPRQAEEAAATIRTLVLADRALNDKAQRAFVSWVRSYTQHQASSIFRIADQDWVDLARGWGLLKLPRMPETKNWDGDYRLGLHIDWDAYAYKDKAREKARLEKMQEERQAAAAGKAGDADDAHRKESAKRSMPWSEKHEKRETKMRKKDRQRAKKEHERWEKMSEEERRRVTETQEMVSKMREENLRLRAERRAFANGGKPSTTAATTAPAGGSSIEDDTFEGFSD